jgi:hypothetical protein
MLASIFFILLSYSLAPKHWEPDILSIVKFPFFLYE